MNHRALNLVVRLLALAAVPGTVALAETNPPPSAASTNALPLTNAAPAKATGPVYVIPIEDAIMEPTVFIVRRGIKDAMADRASVIVLDMNTPGGLVSSVVSIMELLERFPGDVYTFIRKDAYSGGAFVSAATKAIYMAPGSVIGAAAPIAASPGGGAQEMGDTMEVKITSAIAAKIRASAQRNGHNAAVFEAMVNKAAGLKIGDEVICKEGEILTLTNTEAEKEYGDPPRNLLSAGTIESLEALLEQLGYGDREVKRVQPTGAEQVAQWITKIAPILLLLGILGIYIEVKLQTFGVIGILAIICLLIFFFGHYIAGLSGLEFLALFVVGVILVALEIFFFPGTAVLGILGSVFIIISLIMAMVDHMPDGPVVPTLPQLEMPLMKFGIAVAGAIVGAMLLGKYLPKSRLFEAFVLQTASGGDIDAPLPDVRANSLVGETGKAISPLRPAGKAMIGGKLMDVVTEGDHIPTDTAIKVLAVEGTRVVVGRA